MSIRNSLGEACLLAMALVLITGTLKSEPVEIVIPRPCMTEVRLTEKTECHGPDRGHLRCTGFMLTLRPGCEQLRVTK
jgi:hypothetical protein